MIQQLKYLVIIVSCIISSIHNSYSQAITVGFVSVTTTDTKSIQISVIKTDEVKANKFIYYRADNSSNIYKEIGRSGANSFTDMNVDVNKESYCYKVSYIDDTGKESALSQPFCSVFLSLDGTQSITWTPFSKLQNAEPVEYFVDIVNEDGSINRLTSYKTRELSAKIYDIDGVREELDINDKAKVRVRAIQPTSFKLNNFSFINHPIAVYSNIITILPPPSLYFPTAFTPNGDGRNDVFLATGKSIVEFEMTILDRWGNVVYESKDINEGWDGTQIDQSTPALTGNYVYKITAKDKFNRPFQQIGVVMLIK